MAAPHFRQLFQRNFQSFLRYFPSPPSLSLSFSLYCTLYLSLPRALLFVFFKRGLRRNASRTDAECITMLYAKRVPHRPLHRPSCNDIFRGIPPEASPLMLPRCCATSWTRFRLLERLFISPVIFQFTTHLFIQRKNGDPEKRNGKKKECEREVGSR